MKPEQILALVNQLEIPYATLVLFLAITPSRISEAVAVRWPDIDGTDLSEPDI